MNKNNHKLSQGFSTFMMDYKVFLVLAVIVIALLVMSDNFGTSKNLTNVLRQISVTTIVGAAFTLILAIAAIDLSVGSVIGFIGVIMGYLLLAGVPIVLVIIVGVLAGIGTGLANSALITAFALPPFIVTLATSQIYRGAIYVITKMEAVYGLPEDFLSIGQGYTLGVPNPVYIMAVVLIVMYFVVNRTKFGRYVIAMGGNEQATKACGINIVKIRHGVFAIMGACAGIGAIITTARAASAQVNAGDGMEMDAIAAVVIGGTSMMGGNANIFGTLAGCLIVGFVSNGLNLMAVDSNWQIVVKGILILFAVILDSVTTMAFKKSQIKQIAAKAEGAK